MTTRRTTMQETIDAARRPMTIEEERVYAKTNREWQPGRELGPQPILDSLVVKEWLDGAYSILVGCWVYQRRHSLDRDA
ncbi:hypothetical protein LCGC14_0830770 [marine sediment metagenome]|uniref:Uncharacterized protein n=1 Tax=marine sediment metagenome TaxID=412755 RepID=A0A0F9Q1C9_9ZZZZ